MKDEGELEVPEQRKETEKPEEEVEDEVITPQNLKKKSLVTEPTPPFPGRLTKSKQEEANRDILEVLKKVEVNIPLLDCIRDMPLYAKFIKELCTNKRKLRGNEIARVNVSATSHAQLPEKQKDPGVFTIPCTIGNQTFGECLVDLGASINVMPYSAYLESGIGPLQSTQVVVQLADRSIASVAGVVEDVLVKVNGYLFPADFYILQADEITSFSSDSSPLILGRPFLKTARTKIDVHTGTLTMEFAKEIITFHLFDSIKHPEEHVYDISLAAAIPTKVAASEREPWFADLVNYLATGVLPSHLPKAAKDKLKSDARHYFWDDPELFRLCGDQIIRRCVPDHEVQSVLNFSHSLHCGGHFGVERTRRKVLESGLWWPTLHKDAHSFVQNCDRCQRT
jgi:hypothetical protein